MLESNFESLTIQLGDPDCLKLIGTHPFRTTGTRKISLKKPDKKLKNQKTRRMWNHGLFFNSLKLIPTILVCFLPTAQIIATFKFLYSNKLLISPLVWKIFNSNADFGT